MTRAGLVTRLALACCGGALAWAATAILDLRPRPALVVLLVVAGFAFVWLLEDVAGDRHDLDIAAPRARVVPRWGLDPRFLRLAASLRPPHDPQLIAVQVHATLVPLVDERLRAHHGIDRAAEPARARAVMHPALAAYVEQPPQPRRNLNAYLSDIVTRIEDL
jgi:hypothetical protein